MAIFSRRTLRRLINENANFLKKTQTTKHIDELNLNKKEYLKLIEDGKHLNELIRVYLNTEWEIVLLNSLSKSGKVIHDRSYAVEQIFDKNKE